MVKIMANRKRIKEKQEKSTPDYMSYRVLNSSK